MNWKEQSELLKLRIAAAREAQRYLEMAGLNECSENLEEAIAGLDREQTFLWIDNPEKHYH